MRHPKLLIAGAALLLACLPRAAAAQDLPDYLADRGDAIHTSLFGSYVSDGEWLVYPFYEYTRASHADYNPSDFGFALDRDFIGVEKTDEWLIYIAYGLSDRWMVEFESALFVKTSLDRAPNDASGMPPRVSESGLGDTEGQVRWLMMKETADAPELMLMLEVVLPLQEDQRLIGTQHLEFAQGIAVSKGFSFGTLQARYFVGYTTEDHTFETDEVAIEWVKKMSSAQRWVLAVEGSPDETSLIGEVQFTLAYGAVFKLNCGIGLTDAAPDIAPEVGVMWSF